MSFPVIHGRSPTGRSGTPDGCPYGDSEGSTHVETAGNDASDGSFENAIRGSLEPETERSRVDGSDRDSDRIAYAREVSYSTARSFAPVLEGSSVRSSRQVSISSSGIIRISVRTFVSPRRLRSVTA